MVTGDEMLRLEMCRAKWGEVPALDGLGDAVRDPVMVTFGDPDSGMSHV